MLPEPKPEDIISKGTVHFTLGDNLTNLIRQAYWFENRQEWAKETLKCFEGLTEDQMTKILNGDVQFKPSKDRTEMQIISKPDVQFQIILAEHKKFLEDNMVIVGGKHISKRILGLYLKTIKQIEMWKRHGNYDYGTDKFEISETSSFSLSMIAVEQRIANEYYQMLYREAGFKEKSEMSHFQIDACYKFEDALKVHTLTIIQKYRQTYESTIETAKIPLSEKDLIHGKTIYLNILTLKQGENPYPEFDYNRALLKGYDDAMEFLEQLKDKLHPESFAMHFLQRKNLNRRILQEENSWSVLDGAEASVHSLINPQRYHGQHIWKEKQ